MIGSEKYISWHDTKLVTLSNEEFIKKRDEIKAIYPRIQSSKTKIEDWMFGGYSITKQGKYRTLYLFDGNDFIRYSTDTIDDSKNSSHNGTKAIQTLSNHFTDRTGKTLLKAFGTASKEIKRCVPKQFYYINDFEVSTKNHIHILKHVSGVDGCSQYPTGMCGALPTSKGAITIKGTVPPNAGYPFAFYIKSGHIAQLNVFDTHDWLDSEFVMSLFNLNLHNPYLNPEDDITILMHQSEESLTEEYEDFYKLRKVDADAKLVMNASIGMMHTKKYKSYKYAHLAAVAIARANNSILHKAEIIGFDRIIEICVDGIIYHGTEIYGVDYKQLGVYNQEFVDCEVVIAGSNKYIVKDQQGNIVKAKHGGANFDSRTMQKLKDSDEYIAENNLNYTDLFYWVKIDETNEEDE